MSELEELRQSYGALQKRMRDMTLVSDSSKQELEQRFEAIRGVVSDLSMQREQAESQVRHLKATAGQTETSIRNLFQRILKTAPANSIASMHSGAVAAASAASEGSQAGSGAGEGSGGGLGSTATSGGMGGLGSTAGGGLGGTTGSSSSSISAHGHKGGTAHMAVAQARAAEQKAKILGQLVQYLSVIGDRISDLNAIAEEYPAYLDAAGREKEAGGAGGALAAGAGLRGGKGVAGSGIAAVRAGRGGAGAGSGAAAAAAGQSSEGASMLATGRSSSTGVGVALAAAAGPDTDASAELLKWKAKEMAAQRAEKLAKDAALAAAFRQMTIVSSEADMAKAGGAGAEAAGSPGLFRMKFVLGTANNTMAAAVMAAKAGAAAVEGGGEGGAGGAAGGAGSAAGGTSRTMGGGSGGGTSRSRN